MKVDFKVDGETLSKKIHLVFLWVHNNGKDDALNPAINLTFSQKRSENYVVIFALTKYVSLLDSLVLEPKSASDDDVATAIIKNGLHELSTIPGEGARCVAVGFSIENGRFYFATEKVIETFSERIPTEFDIALYAKASNSRKFTLSRKSRLKISNWNDISLSLK